jgi:hypothetical protein
MRDDSTNPSPASAGEDWISPDDPNWKPPLIDTEAVRRMLNWLAECRTEDEVEHRRYCAKLGKEEKRQYRMYRDGNR